MSRHYRHEPFSSRSDGETEQFLMRDGRPAGSSASNHLQADAKRHRRRQQVREAQARFRDRKDRTVEELKHRTVLLSEALEKVKADNRVLRARLSRYERIDLVGDDPMDGIAGLGGRSPSSVTWPISSTDQRQRRPLSQGSRPPLLSDPSVSGWDQGQNGYMTAEPVPMGTSMPFGGRDQANMPPAPRTYDPGTRANEQMQRSPHSMSQGSDEGTFNLVDNSPISAADARYRRLQEDFMGSNPSDPSQGDGGRRDARLGVRFSELGLGLQRDWRGCLSADQQMPPPRSMQLRNQGRPNSGSGRSGNAGGHIADGGGQQPSQGARAMRAPPIHGNLQTPLGRVSRWQASMAATDMSGVVPEVSSRHPDQASTRGRHGLPNGDVERSRRPGMGR